MSGCILLIGGTGFLGSVVAHMLAERDVVALVRPSSDTSVLPAGMATCLGDLAQPALPLENVESVVYCASMGFGHVPPLVPRLVSAGVRRAVFVSTTAIFTSLPAASRAVRLAAEAAVQQSELDWTILRPTMIYGTARDRNISRLLRWLRRWPVFPLCANAVWQPVHVEDVARAVVLALDTPAASGGAYNVAGADPLRFSELVRVAAAAVGRRVLLLPVPLQAAVVGANLTRIVTPEQVQRLAEDKAYSIEDAKRDLGYNPRTFHQGVAEEARLLGLATS